MTSDAAQSRAALAAHLASLTRNEVSALCAMVACPGEADDTAPRMALHALALRAGDADATSQRQMVCEVLCEQLRAERPAAVKQFFLRQLQLIGDQDAVSSVSLLVKDEALASTAIQTLLAIDGDAARAALRSALGTSSSATRLAIINALGVLRDEKAADALATYVSSDDPDQMWAALNALAALGVETSAGSEMKAINPQAPFDRARLVNVLLLAARQLAANGRDDLAGEILHSAYYSQSPNVGSHERCAVLSSLVEVLEADAIDTIVDALHSDDPELRATAGVAGARLQSPDATARLAEHLDHVSAPAAVDLLHLLAARKDPAAEAHLRNALNDEDLRVRIAAIEALAETGGTTAIGSLVSALKSAQPDERAAIQHALIAMHTPRVTTTVANTLPTVDPGTRAALLEVLAMRGGPDQLGAIRRCMRDEDDGVRIAAVRAFGAIADGQQAPVLLTRLETWSQLELREAMIDALSAVCRRGAPDSRAAGQPIIEHLNPENTGCYVIQLRALGRLGSPAALGLIGEAVRDERTEVSEAAMRALSDWPDGSAAAIALDAARGTPDAKLHVLGLRAFARMLPRRAPSELDETMRLFRQAMASARRLEEKRLLLARLADVPDTKILPALTMYLGDGALRPEAAAAVLRAAESLLPHGWAAACDALESVIGTYGVSDELRTMAQTLLARARQYEDYIVDWMVAGPFREPGQEGQALFDVAFPPETPGETNTVWKRQPVDANPDRYWYIDLDKSAGGAHAAAYLQTHVHSASAQPVLLELGSDDGVKVWLNGELIHANNVPRGCAPGSDKVPAKLRGGWNLLLLKVVNGGGAWGACARLRATDGSALHDISVDAQPAPLSITPEQAGPEPGQPTPAPAAPRDNGAGAATETQPDAPPTEIAETQPAPAADGDGWQPLFNEEDLSGWRCPPGSWQVVDKQLVCAGGGYIWTEKQYGDFELELEFKIPPAGNSGVFFRTANIDDPVQTGIEFQIYDTYGKQSIRRNHCGAIYDCMAPSTQAVRPPGEWNQVRLRCEGPIIQAWLNEEPIIEMNLDQWTDPHKNPDGTRNKFNAAYRDMPRCGFIGLQDHGQPVWFREMRIRELGSTN